jgi:hypothetical protein
MKTSVSTSAPHEPRADRSAAVPQGDGAPTRLIPVPRWNDYHDWPPPGGLRYLIFHADTNGYSTAFKRVGRRVLVDEAEFFRCIERNQRSSDR